MTNIPIPDRDDPLSYNKGDEFFQAIGRRVREARHKSGLTPLEVIEKAEISKGWLYGVEAGQQNFTILMFRRLLRVLGAEFSDIFVSDDQAQNKILKEKLHSIASRTVLQAGAATHALSEIRSLSDELRILTDGSASPGKPRSP